MRYARVRRSATAPRCLALLLLVATATFLSACGGHGMYIRPGIETCVGCGPQGATLDTRVVLIGDTGEGDPDNPNLDLLRTIASVDPDRTLVLFLGDNVYPRGLPASTEAGAEQERGTAEAILRLWLEPVERAGAPAVFLPGNHDWRRGREGGIDRIREQERWLQTNAADPMAVRLLPGDACPGPVVMDVGDRVRVVLADTQWLLGGDRARGEDCRWGIPGAEQDLEAASAADPADGRASNLDFYAALEVAVGGAGDRSVLFAGHHPLRTEGPHGGYVSGKDMFFPLTHVQSWLYLPIPFLYPIVRHGVVKHPQDVRNPEYAAMIAGIDAALEAAPAPVVTAAGHEHVLQVFREASGRVHAVSGAGAKRDGVGTADDTLFKHGDLGLMTVEYFVDGRVLLRVIEPREAGPGSEVFATWVVEDPTR